MKQNAKLKLIIIGSIIIISLIANTLLNLKSPTGKVTSTVNVSRTGDTVDCDIQISPGWNLISYYCLKGSWYTGPSSFNGMEDSITQAFAYESATPPDNWKSYNAALPLWAVKDLNMMHAQKGYWVYSNTSGTITINGSKIGNTSIALIQGWNLIGYPNENQKNISEALQTINGNYTAVWMYNSSNTAWYVYYPSGSNSTFYEFTPGYGYWINMTTNDTLVIDW